MGTFASERSVVAAAKGSVCQSAVEKAVDRVLLHRAMVKCCFVFTLVTCVLGCGLFGQVSADAVEIVTFKSDRNDLNNGLPQATRTVTGRVLLAGQDGSMMLQSDDGRIWTIQPEQIIKRESNDKPFTPITCNEMVKRMSQEFPRGIQVYRTKHYIILHNSNRQHINQVGRLFEQLYKAFYTYWDNQDWPLEEPEFPLVALVFADRNQFLKYGTAEVGDAVDSLIGYYNLATNRMTTYNVPDWERNLSTIIHEATHQLAYNSGLQRRFADNPTWVSEGLAMYFEAPDMRNMSRWSGIGEVNQKNLKRWREYSTRRPSNSLSLLIGDDTRIMSAETALDAYGEAWALTYYLIRTHKEEYLKYLRTISESKIGTQLTPHQRLKMFSSAFGKSLPDIDREFQLYMHKVR